MTRTLIILLLFTSLAYADMFDPIDPKPTVQTETSLFEYHFECPEHGKIDYHDTVWECVDPINGKLEAHCPLCNSTLKMRIE